jgi:hypothetical protein
LFVVPTAYTLLARDRSTACAGEDLLVVLSKATE